MTISEEKKGFLSPRQYSGLTLPEVTVVIDRISEIHAVTTAMFISKSTASAENTNENLNWLLEEENDNNVTQEESNAYREDVDLVFRTLAHFLRRVPGYLDKHSLICKIRPALVDNACQTLPRSQLPLKCLTHGELYERNVLFNHVRRSRSCGLVKNVVSDDFARDEDEMEDESEADAKALSNVDISALLTDWKHSSVSSPSSDLAFFFLSSTSQAMREKYTQDWLEQYYFSFTECLRSKFGIKLANVYPEFDFDVFCKDFKKHVYRAYLQAVQALTRELRFVENEFHYVKGDEERERAGQSLKFVGRRLLELVDELIEIINAKDWRRDNSFYLGLNKDESVSMTIKLAASTK